MTFPPQVVFEALVVPMAIAFVWAVPAMLAGGRGRAILSLGAAATVIVTYVFIIDWPSLEPTTSLGRFIHVPVLAVILAVVCALAKAGTRLVQGLTVALATVGAGWTVYPQLMLGDMAALLSVAGVALVAFIAAERMTALSNAPAPAVSMIIALAFGLFLMTAWGQQTAAAQLALSMLAGALAVFWIALGAPTIGWGPIAGLATLPAPVTLAAWQVSYGAGIDWAVLPLAFIPVAAAALAVQGSSNSLIGRLRLAFWNVVGLGCVMMLAMGALGWLVLPELLNLP
ncbi:MAG: hypothetical protein NXI16_04965 [Alphaproteobacteria bacterium]|nr:hypothetical protein [Alphaproteobacteria bacterium]